MRGNGWCDTAVSLDDFAGGVLVTAAYMVVYLVDVRTPGVVGVAARCLADPLLLHACPLSGLRWDMAVCLQPRRNCRVFGSLQLYFLLLEPMSTYSDILPG